LTIQFSQYGELVSTLEHLLGEALFFFQHDPLWEGRTGAYFCLADAKTGDLLFAPVAIGPVPKEKAKKYLALCQEKAKRLASHTDHLASSESRNSDVGQWGGAVRAGDVILSMSGLPEMGDEALMFVLAEIYVATSVGSGSVMLGFGAVVAINANPYWRPLRGFLGRLV